jgi:hypothetical protein
VDDDSDEYNADLDVSGDDKVNDVSGDDHH